MQTDSDLVGTKSGSYRMLGDLFTFVKMNEPDVVLLAKRYFSQVALLRCPQSFFTAEVIKWF